MGKETTLILIPEFLMRRLHQDTNSLPMRLVRPQERLSCRFADHVVTVSEHWCQALIQRGLPAYKCSVTMNVADDPHKKFNQRYNWPAQRTEYIHLVDQLAQCRTD